MSGIVELVVPPFFPYEMPALGASQLKANLNAAGYKCRVHYFNVRAAERLGCSLFDMIWHAGDHSGESPLLGEYLFSLAMFETSEERVQEYVDRLLKSTRTASVLRSFFPKHSVAGILRKLSSELAALTDELLKPILESKPWMIGFTSSFQTNCGALYAIKRIKALSPETITIIGGANCLGEMGTELLARFPDIDYVANGESDKSFVEFVAALDRGEAAEVVGITGRKRPRQDPLKIQSQGGDEKGTLLNKEEFCALPPPVLDEYFEEMPRLGLGPTEGIVPYQAARGCWWGEKHACTFCAVNLQGMAFRSRDPQQVFRETQALLKKYNSTKLFIVDSILDNQYFNTLFRWMADEPPIEFHFETTVNLKKDQVIILRKAGARNVNPGLEHLSDHSLKLLVKPNNTLKNITALKWFADVGTRVQWSILCGAPGETEASIDEMVANVRLVAHLQPPGGANAIRVERYSPYFEEPERFKFEPPKPTPAYQYIYPFPEDALRRLAERFDNEHFRAARDSELVKRVHGAVDEWKRVHPLSHLVAFEFPRSLWVVDTRPCAQKRLHRLKGLERAILEYCDEGHGLRAIATHHEKEASADEVEKAVKVLLEAKLVVKLGSTYLSLVNYWSKNYRNYTELFRPDKGIRIDSGLVTRINGDARTLQAARNALRWRRMRRTIAGMPASMLTASFACLGLFTSRDTPTARLYRLETN